MIERWKTSNYTWQVAGNVIACRERHDALKHRRLRARAEISLCTACRLLPPNLLSHSLISRVGAHLGEDKQVP